MRRKGRLVPNNGSRRQESQKPQGTCPGLRRLVETLTNQQEDLKFVKPPGYLLISVPEESTEDLRPREVYVSSGAKS